MDLHTIKTPSLVLDAGRVRRNAEAMSARVRRLGASLRPHVKTHKCVEVARIQTEGHDGRVTVSTLAEALEIPRLVERARSLRFAGILTHAGHSYHARSREELLSIARHERDLMKDF